MRSHRRHDATPFAVGKFVQTRRNCRQLVANCVADTPHNGMNTRISLSGEVLEEVESFVYLGSIFTPRALRS